ncbi:transmembrane protease serine 9-like [Anomaloglossus baeobatrachus]
MYTGVLGERLTSSLVFCSSLLHNMKSLVLELHLLTSVLVLGFVKRKVAGCGQPPFSLRIVGGQSSVPGKWPWQISVMRGDTHLCGGSLISRSWVVTAAHCMSSESGEMTVRKRRRISRNSKDRRRHQKRQTFGAFYVMLGSLYLTVVSSTRVIVPVKNIIIHPICSGDGTSGDLALMELEGPVTFNFNIQPICLPSPDQVFPDGMMCWVTGWGDTGEGVKLSSPYVLQEVDLPLINSSACDKMFKDVYNITSSIALVQDDMICAGYREGEKDGCQGDSGGPLVCNNGDSWILVGSVSWGDGCAQPNKPGVYAKTSNFSSWIKQICGVAAFSEMKKDTSTMDISTITTEKTKVEPVCAFEVTNRGTVPNGKMLQMTISFLVGVFVLTRILDVVTPEKIRDQFPEKIRDQFPEKIRDQFPEKIRNHFPEKIRYQFPEKIRDHFPEKIRNHFPEKIRDQFPEKIIDQFPEKIRDQFPEKIRDQFPVKITEQFPEKIIDQFPEKNRDQFPEKIRYQFPKKIRDLFPEKIRYQFPEKIRDHFPEKIQNHDFCKKRLKNICTRKEGAQVTMWGNSARPKLLASLLLLTILFDGVIASPSLSGLASSRIVNGTDAVEGEWPWQVSLLYQKQEVLYHICGGSLITAQWVMTAAHCVINDFTLNNSYVLLGVYRLQDLYSKGVFRFLQRIIHDLQYTGVTSGGDIALLKLASPVSYTKNIRPICLPAASASTAFPVGMECWVTGWGNIGTGVELPNPKTLQKVPAPLIDRATCQEMYLEGNASNAKILDDMICAGYKEGQKSFCQGDSGGALVCKVMGNWFQVGIVSWTVGCALPNYPPVYTLVTFYQSWIQNYIPEVEFSTMADIAGQNVTCSGSRCHPDAPWTLLCAGILILGYT